MQFEQIVVTGASTALSQLRSPSSVTSLDADAVARAAPDNAADVLRNVPGLVVQASGGEGNANLSARGLPVSGGAKLVLFHEDGLPVLGFGDIDFGTADTFLRIDGNLERIEIVRGGPAATFASNAPGGVVNLISKTGDVESGEIGATRGLTFDRTRVDFDYGMPLDGRWRFHLGGYYRAGEGPRTVGYRAEQGGQLKGNLTREFDGGYLRVNVKWLRDRTPAFLPVPVSITGTTGSPVVGSLPGFDVRNGALHSRDFRTDLSVDRDGRVVRTELADGYDSNSRALGFEAALRFGGGWQLRNRFRISATDGRFVAPYPAQIDTAAALATSIGGAGASLRYATGPSAGQAIADPAALNGNGLAVRTHLFDTTLNDLGLIVDDLRFTKTIEAGTGAGTAAGVRTSVTLGWFKSRQKIDEDWHWNTYLVEAKGKDAALLDVVDAQGRVVTQGGLVAYGEPYWGNCCVRSYRLRYETDAPYLMLNLVRGPLDVDASVRYDNARARGSYAGASGTTAIDVDGDGRLQAPELAVPVVDERGASPVHYTVRYLSYSLGVNWLLGADTALFARASEGGRANAERVLFGGGIRPDGSIAKKVAVNTVQQLEGGFKWRSRRASVSATFFRATTEVTDQDVTSTTERFTSRRYEATGLELEAAWALGAFGLRGGLTYTHGRIARDDLAPANAGQQVNPRWVWQLAPRYRAGGLDLGVNVLGTSKAPIGGGIAAPGFVQVNAVASQALGGGWRASVAANNLFNRIGLTEIPNAAAGVAGNGANLARSINGRTLSASVVQSF